jgi:HlyD family secretion protein
MENDAIESRSEEVQEILAYSPNWIMRWGIGLILAIVSFLLCVSWYIKYPDVIPSRITITNSSPLASLVARSSGKLILYVRQGDTVKSNACLGAIENPANVHHVLLLKEELESFKSLLFGNAGHTDFDFNTNLSVGELQTDYSSFLQSHIDYRSFLLARYHAKKTASIQGQVSSCRVLALRLTDQKHILEDEVNLAYRKYTGDKTLFDKNLISRVELISSETAYLAQKHALQTAESNILGNDIQLEEYEKSILDLNQQFHDTRRTLLVALQESLKKLLSQIAAWEQKYVLTSPIDGRVSFFRFWNNNQYVNVGNEIMVVLPTADNTIGRIFLLQAGAGKLKVGQRVNIELDNYPYREFGIVQGEVLLVSPVSRESQYSITVRLPRGLRTSYNRDLEFKEEMQGNAYIVTNDLRLIQRLFNQLYSVVKNST